jgi:6-phosphofructokinase 1
MIKKRFGIINSGGDCPGLNTVIDAVVKSLENEFEIYGFYKGFEGLLDLNFIKLSSDFTSNIRFEGGTFLKSVNKGNFAGKSGTGELKKLDDSILEKSLENYKKLELEALVILGGDGTMAAAVQLQEIGINIVGIPKSIDNDLTGTDFTFGFNTAVEITTEALDRIHTTAKSHDRIMILEVMGRYTGWISLYSGFAGGADMILIPEIPFDQKKIVEYFKQKYASGQTHGLIVVAEGAKDLLGGITTKNIGNKSSEVSLGGIGDQIKLLLNLEPELEARCTVLGHLQRGGSPNSWDRILSRSYGVFASTLVKDQKYGTLVGYIDGNFTYSNIENCIKSLKTVDPHSHFVKQIRKLGVSFGD